MTTESLPPVSQTKFMEMGDWAKGAFNQIESMGRFGIKEGNGDQAVINQALESFSQDVAYSGVVAAYERSQILAWARDDGPLATKFDILIHHFDTTKELLTNTEARRQVQAVIVNLCGGTERYKYLYEDGAESFAVANLVEAAVGLWGRSQSKQARIDEATVLMVRQRGVAQKAIDQVDAPAAAAEPAEPEWGDEQRAVAEKFYHEELKPGEQKKVDSLITSLMAASKDEEFIIEGIGNLPQAKHDWDMAKGTLADFDWIAELALGEMFKVGSVRENLLAVMSIREVPKKGKDRGEQIIQHHRFYIQLADALRWRIEVIGPEIEKATKLAEKKQVFIQALDKVTLLASMPKPDEGLGKRLESLRITAKSEFDLGLPGKIIDEIHFEETGLNEEFAKVWLRLNEGYEGGDLFIDCKTTKGEAGKVLIAMAYSKAAMPTGYEFRSLENGIQLVRIEDKAVLAVIGGGENQFTVTSEKTVDLLQAAHVVGQTYLNLQGIKQEFPYFTLGNLPNLEKLTEPEAAEVEAKKAKPESKEPAPPTKQTSVPNPEEAEENKSELPDWLKGLEKNIQQPVESPGGAEPVVELQAAAPAALPVLPVEPEPPKIIPVNSMAEIARIIKEKGVGEVQIGPSFLRSMVDLAVDGIRQTINIKGVTITGVTVDDQSWRVNNGLALSLTAQGRYGILPVNAEVSFKLDGNFNLTGQPEYKLPKGPYDKDEARQNILGYIRGFKNRLSQIMATELRRSNISSEGMENPRIVGQNTIVTIRGKVISR